MQTTTSDEIVRDPVGLYPSATVACFDATCGELPRRQLDVSRNIAFLERLARLGVPAALLGASTGHGHLRTVEELREWFFVAAQANVGRMLKISLLRPEDGLEANASLLSDLKQLSYPVVFVRPGTNLSRNMSDIEVAANLRPIVEQASSLGFAVGVYSIPDVSGVRLTADAAAQLVRGPGGERIVAAKITEADYESSTRRFLEHPDLARLKIVQGWDPHIARALRDGLQPTGKGRQRCGVTSGPMNFAVYQYLHILRAAALGDWDEVQSAQEGVNLLFRAMQDDPLRFADLQRAKYVMGLGHPLTGTIESAPVRQIIGALASVPRTSDRRRLAMSLDLMGDGPHHGELARWASGDVETTLDQIRRRVAEFVAERDWQQFHSPKNLSMSLAIEAAELMEHFQWITTEQSRNAAEDVRKRQAIGEELADVLCYVLALANELNIDLATALDDKMIKNESKYPAQDYRGRYGPEDAGRADV